jgi:hypothetical protein
MFCNNIVLPDPLGPNITDLEGNLAHISYLDCFDVYSSTFIGFMLGVIISI